MPDRRGRDENPALSTVQVLAEKLTGEISLSNERDRRYEERFRAMDEKTSLALNASEKAVTKAEVAQEKRFDNTNEWRAAMQDRDRNQMPRSEIEQRFSAIKSQQNWTIGIIITIFSIIAGLIITIFHH